MKHFLSVTSFYIVRSKFVSEVTSFAILLVMTFHLYLHESKKHHACKILCQYGDRTVTWVYCLLLYLYVCCRQNMVSSLPLLNFVPLCKSVNVCKFVCV